MEHYVTLFNKLFLPQGLALHSSLVRHAGEFTLWVICLDDETRRVIESCNLPSLRAIELRSVETPELQKVKSGRTLVEYCWTLTPFAPKAVFERASDARRVTYLDSDVFLLKSPRPIFEEFERTGKSVLITDHAYDAEYDQTLISGQFCVQFLTFVRDSGELVRKWWEDRCVEWCFARAEESKFGDQKYLDEWPLRFHTLVHVLQQQHLLLAPWNAKRFPYSGAVAWHFHGLRLLGRGKVLLHNYYSVPDIVDRLVYGPYLRELSRSLEIIGTEVVQKERRELTRQRFVHVAKECWASLRNWKALDRTVIGDLEK